MRIYVIFEWFVRLKSRALEMNLTVQTPRPRKAANLPRGAAPP